MNRLKLLVEHYNHFAFRHSTYSLPQRFDLVEYHFTLRRRRRLAYCAAKNVRNVTTFASAKIVILSHNNFVEAFGRHSRSAVDN